MQLSQPAQRALGGFLDAVDATRSHAYVTGIRKASVRTGLIAKEQTPGFGLELADQGSEVALPSADGAQEDRLGAPLFRGIGHGDGLFMYIQSDIKHGRGFHG